MAGRKKLVIEESWCKGCGICAAGVKAAGYALLSVLSKYWKFKRKKYLSSIRNSALPVDFASCAVQITRSIW